MTFPGVSQKQLYRQTNRHDHPSSTYRLTKKLAQLTLSYQGASPKYTQSSDRLLSSVTCPCPFTVNGKHGLVPLPRWYRVGFLMVQSEEGWRLLTTNGMEELGVFGDDPCPIQFAYIENRNMMYHVIMYDVTDVSTHLSKNSLHSWTKWCNPSPRMLPLY